MRRGVPRRPARNMTNRYYTLFDRRYAARGLVMIESLPGFLRDVV